MAKRKNNRTRKKKRKPFAPAEHSNKKAEEGKVRILVVDDHPIVRQGFVQLTMGESDLFICGEAANAHEAMAAIEKTKPDMAIIDISLEGVNGIELIKNIKARYKSFPVLVASMHNESLYAERALRAGARGYITKKETSKSLTHAIRRVMDGDLYISENMSKKMLSRMITGDSGAAGSPMDSLTDRELEVFEHIGRGVSTREIAGKLHISIKTVESYRANIKSKLDLKNSTELVRHAVRWVLDKDAE